MRFMIRAVTKQPLCRSSKNDSCHELIVKWSRKQHMDHLQMFLKDHSVFHFAIHICFDVTHKFVTCKTYLCNHSEAYIINYNSPCKSFKKEGGDDDNSCVTVNYTDNYSQSL